MKCLTDKTVASNSSFIIEYFVSVEHEVRNAKAVGRSFLMSPWGKFPPIASVVKRNCY